MKAYARIIQSLVLLALTTTGAQVLAQNTLVAYQGRILDHGTNFTGTGLFKFALVTGPTWLPCASAPSASWYSIASSADGTKLVAASQGLPIYTSNDSGATWTARGSSQQWYPVASSADGTRLVAGAIPAWSISLRPQQRRAPPAT